MVMERVLGRIHGRAHHRRSEGEARFETNGCEVERHTLTGDQTSKESCDLHQSWETGQGSSGIFSYIGGQDIG